MMKIAICERNLGYEEQKISSHINGCGFIFEDILFNAALLRANEDALTMASLLLADRLQPGPTANIVTIQRTSQSRKWMSATLAAFARANLRYTLPGNPGAFVLHGVDDFRRRDQAPVSTSVSTLSVGSISPLIVARVLPKQVRIGLEQAMFSSSFWGEYPVCNRRLYTTTHINVLIATGLAESSNKASGGAAYLRTQTLSALESGFFRDSYSCDAAEPLLDVETFGSPPAGSLRPSSTSSQTAALAILIFNSSLPSPPAAPPFSSTITVIIMVVELGFALIVGLSCVGLALFSIRKISAADGTYNYNSAEYMAVPALNGEASSQGSPNGHASVSTSSPRWGTKG